MILKQYRVKVYVDKDNKKDIYTHTIEASATTATESLLFLARM